MGMFDTVHVGSRAAQLKVWAKAMRWYHVGDVVGPPRGGLAPGGTYSVEMTTGGYVHVEDGIITAWEDAPGAGPVVDVLGEAAVVLPADVLQLQLQRPGQAESPPRCERCAAPRLRPLREREIAHDDALARAIEEAERAISAEPDPARRLDAARATLADESGYLHVTLEKAVRLLGMDVDPVRGAGLLVELLRDSAEGAPELSMAASLVGRQAARLPLAQLIALLRVLAARLPLSGDTYAELDVASAGRAVVAAHGAPALDGIPVALWCYDVVARALVADVLEQRLGRALTRDERWVARSALRDEPGFLDDLTPARIDALLAQAVAA